MKYYAGVMNWGKWGADFSKLQYQEMIDFCMQNGINTFDHADIYGDYTTEFEFGQALKPMHLERDSYKIITKCGIKLVTENRPTHTLKSYDTTFDHIVMSVENSLNNLQCDYLDLLLIHRPDYFCDYKQIAEAFQYLEESGKVNSFGVSNFNRNQLDTVSKYAKIVNNQIELSWCKHEHIIDGYVDYMIANDIEINAWSPLGVKYENKLYDLKYPIISNLVAKYDCQNESNLRLLWLLSHPAGIIPIIGTSQKDRIVSYLNMKTKMTSEDWYAYLELIVEKEVP